MKNNIDAMGAVFVAMIVICMMLLLSAFADILAAWGIALPF